MTGLGKMSNKCINSGRLLREDDNSVEEKENMCLNI
jgi:hypothetical protein